MADTRKACPNCESLHLYERAENPHGRGKRDGDVTARYVCKECGERFNVPVFRERDGISSTGPGNNGLAQYLAHPDVTTIDEARARARKAREDSA